MSETEQTDPNKVVVEDKRGRSIEVRKLKPVEKMRLLQLIGPDNSMNGPYLGYAIFAYAVTKVDDQLRPVPASLSALEATVKLLDDDGLEACAEAFKKLNPAPPSDDEVNGATKN